MRNPISFLINTCIICLVLASCQPHVAPPTQNTVASKVEIAPLENESKAVTFPSLDSLTIFANWYSVDDAAPVIVLCHQARFNKFEYDGIAPALQKMGFNCLAIDQRSGGPISSVQNQTFLEAKKHGKPHDYLDAEQDMKAAVLYAKQQTKGKVILWGSSYSSTLALYLAIQMEEVAAVVSFSPGNYLAEDKGSLIDQLEGFKKPMYLTSSKPESKWVAELLGKHPLEAYQIQFTPEGNGHHGSRALWKNQEGSEEYWASITAFLNALK